MPTEATLEPALPGGSDSIRSLTAEAQVRHAADPGMPLESLRLLAQDNPATPVAVAGNAAADPAMQSRGGLGDPTVNDFLAVRSPISAAEPATSDTVVPPGGPTQEWEPVAAASGDSGQGSPPRELTGRQASGAAPKRRRLILIAGGISVVAVLALLTAVVAFRAETVPHPETHVGSLSPTAEATTCMSVADFTYRKAACVTGTGSTKSIVSDGIAIDIGPFSTPDAWAATASLTGQSRAGEDCAALDTVLSSANITTRKINVADKSVSEPGDPGAEWHVLVSIGGFGTQPGSIIDGCSWTVTFS